MSQLENRLSKLEQAAARAAPVERKTGWAEMHAALRKVYGDGLEYSAEQLARLDSVHPLAGVVDLDAQANGARHEQPKNES